MTPGRPLPGFGKTVLPGAVAKGVGVIAMKVMGQGTIVGKGEGRSIPEELIRYALSLPVSALSISHTSLPILEQNGSAAVSFRAMGEEEMAELRSRLS